MRIHHQKQHITTASRVFVAAFAITALGAGCAHHHRHHRDRGASDNARKAHAHLAALGASGVTGHVVFIEQADGVRIKGRIMGLTPNTLHGFHVHEKGDCSAADGSSAGDHFGPAGHQHGSPMATGSHLGDLGNVIADASGMAQFDMVKTGATLGDAKESSYMGRSVIVHEKADDLTSQPSGASGPRHACAVIEAKTCACRHDAKQ